VNKAHQGARELTGEKQKLVWAEFSTLSLAVLMISTYLFTWMHAHIYSRKLGPGLVLLAQVCPWLHILYYTGYLELILKKISFPANNDFKQLV
jgi:hypothetical protein